MSMGEGRERTEERSQSTDRPSIAEAEHKGERERERGGRDARSWLQPSIVTDVESFVNSQGAICSADCEQNQITCNPGRGTVITCNYV